MRGSTGVAERGRGEAMDGRETAEGEKQQDLTPLSRKSFTDVWAICIWCYLGWSRFADHLSLMQRRKSAFIPTESRLSKTRGPKAHRIVRQGEVAEDLSPPECNAWTALDLLDLQHIPKWTISLGARAIPVFMNCAGVL